MRSMQSAELEERFFIERAQVLQKDMDYIGQLFSKSVDIINALIEGKEGSLA